MCERQPCDFSEPNSHPSTYRIDTTYLPRRTFTRAQTGQIVQVTGVFGRLQHRTDETGPMLELLPFVLRWAGRDETPVYSDLRVTPSCRTRGGVEGILDPGITNETPNNADGPHTDSVRVESALPCGEDEEFGSTVWIDGERCGGHYSDTLLTNPVRLY